MNESLKKVIPNSVITALEKRGLKPEAFLDAVSADMDKNGELRSLYLILTDKRFILVVSDQSGEMIFSGASPASHRPVEGVGELYQYELSRIANPKILDQVVGGLFMADIDGIETWICAIFV